MIGGGLSETEMTHGCNGGNINGCRKLSQPGIVQGSTRIVNINSISIKPKNEVCDVLKVGSADRDYNSDPYISIDEGEELIST